MGTGCEDIESAIHVQEAVGVYSENLQGAESSAPTKPPPRWAVALTITVGIAAFLSLVHSRYV